MTNIRPGPQAEHATTSRWVSATTTALSFAAGPVLILVLFPWLVTRFQLGTPPWPFGLRALGSALIALGALVNVLAFARFPAEGAGTLLPSRSSSSAVLTGGPYRYLRHPMYVSYFVVIIGEALALSRPVLFGYLLAVVAIVAGFVHWWEEPAMARRLGAAYEAYRRQVPSWWPRRPPPTPPALSAEQDGPSSA